MSFWQRLFGRAEGSSQQPATPVQKVACAKCGALVLPRTAKRTGGLCTPCYQRSQYKPPKRTAGESPQEALARQGESLEETLLRQQARRALRKAFKPGTKVRIRGEVDLEWRGRLGTVKAVDVVSQPAFSGTDMMLSAIRYTVAVDGTDLEFYRQDALEPLEE